jgi:hypothetical protein
MLKNILLILGAIFLGIISLIGVAFIFFMTEGKQLDAESLAYVDTVVPVIVEKWDQKELEKRESIEFRGNTSSAQLSKLFNIFKKLGKFKKYNGAQGATSVSYFTGTDKTISGKYTARAEFEHGMATIYLYLFKRDKEWQIAGFRVDSPLFIEQKS